MRDKKNQIKIAAERAAKEIQEALSETRRITDCPAVLELAEIVRELRGSNKTT